MNGRSARSCAAGDDVQRRVEDVGVERAGPDQRRHFFQRARARQLRDVVSAVVQLAVGDERDRRLQDRHAPAQRVGRGFFRIAALLGADAQALHVLARVAPLRAAVPGTGSERMKPRLTYAYSVARLTPSRLGVAPLGVAAIRSSGPWVDYTINVDDKGNRT